MATVIPMNTPSRQPFGLLNDTKLRSLQSVKNRQNAIPVNTSQPSLKRRAASPETSDSENVDPSLLDYAAKRKRSAFDEDVSLCKSARYSLNTITTTKARTTSTITTPRIEATPKSFLAPVSAPAAAGRSPPRQKVQGVLGQKRRFAPPSFGTKAPSLSIAAALNGTIAHKKPRKARTIEESKPKSWFFDIYEEPEEQQNYRMDEWTMTQNATVLDISDDEGNATKDRADRGKENIDPNGISVTMTRSMTAAVNTVAFVPKVSRKDEVIDEPRTPLGDLNPANYYGEGLDATSVVLVHTDVESAEKEAEAQVIHVPEKEVEQVFSSATPIAPPMDSSLDLQTSDIGAILMSATPQWQIETDALQEGAQLSCYDDLIGSSSTNLEIWESESAKDENEKFDVDVTDILQQDAFVLAEL